MKKAVKNQRTKSESRYLRYDFKTEEITQKGRDFAQLTREIGALKDDAKRVASDFKAKITAKESDGSVLCSAINTGYEMRNIPVTVIFNKPKNGKKTVTRDDSGATVAVEDMTGDEMQDELDLETAKAKKPVAPEVKGTPVLTDEQAAAAKAVLEGEQAK